MWELSRSDSLSKIVFYTNSFCTVKTVWPERKPGASLYEIKLSPATAVLEPNSITKHNQIMA